MDNKETLAIKFFNTTVACAKDHELYLKYSKIKQNYIRTEAIEFLFELIRKYGVLIDQLYFVFGDRYVITIDNYDEISDSKILDDISYIGERIPFYALMREGEKELASHVLDKIISPSATQQENDVEKDEKRKK